MLEELSTRAALPPGQQIFVHGPGERRLHHRLHDAAPWSASAAAGREPPSPPPPRRLGPPPLARERRRRCARSWCGSSRASGSTSRRGCTQVPIVAKLEQRALHARRLPAAADEPAPAGGRGRALDRARGLADHGRDLAAALALHPPRRATSTATSRCWSATTCGGRRAGGDHAARRRTSAARRSRRGCSTARARRTRSTCWGRCSSSRAWARAGGALGRAHPEQLGLSDDQVSFLLYHGDNDDTHLGQLEGALDSGLLDAELAERIVKTAKVTARLYRLQLEELGNV